MNGNRSLDTSIAVELMRGNSSIIDRLAAAGAVCLSVIALGELYAGARKSDRIENNLAIIDEFASTVTLLACTVTTAREYSAIKDELRLKGMLIPENDMWIAASARQFGLTLVTRDAHFAAVDGLSIETW